ncbi:hypothetical protein BDR26DRAFT_896143 [Obelidium mucronatum]|nr:hypothetical protein BDR26DRAFT_896143 [Obelidium mucronatum]
MANSFPAITTDDFSRLASDFAERFDHLEAQLSLFRPVALKMAQFCKQQQRGTAAGFTTPKTIEPFQSLDEEMKYHSSSFRDQEHHLNDRYASSFALDVEDEWVKKMDFNNSDTPAIHLDTQYIADQSGTPSLSNLIFESTENSKKASKLNLFSGGGVGWRDPRIISALLGAWTCSKGSRQEYLMWEGGHNSAIVYLHLEFHPYVNNDAALKLIHLQYPFTL